MNTYNRIFVPIGTDCGIAAILKSNNLRLFSLPFDWVVTYNGVTDIIANKFKGYLFPDKQTVACNTKFVHNTFPTDYETMNRRINRFMDLLENEEKELIFIRKGHYIHHHSEAEKNNCILKNDLQDSYDLNRHLKTTYPNLKYKIIVFLCCEKCFKYNEKVSLNNLSIPSTIEIYNIAKKTTMAEKDTIFNNKINEILRKYK